MHLYVSLSPPTQNSIRHNLSLHSRFMRVQNEGTGKSSWWMVNPEGTKSGKPPRRRAASMDNNNKFAKSRGRAAKKKVSVQGVMDENTSSPVSQYSSWLGDSPSSHSNDTFEEWTSFRARASSDASTLSRCHSPFLPEPDDLGEGAEAHLGYQVASGAKMVTPLPSLAEVAGSLGHRSSANSMMEGLLNNLNLLSPKIQPQETSHDSSMMQSNTVYHHPYTLPPVAPSRLPPPEYPKSLYTHTPMNSFTPVPMRPLSDPKVRPAEMVRFLGHYSNPEAQRTSHELPLLCMETMVSHAGGGGRGGLQPLHSGQGRPGHEGKMASPVPTQPPHPHHHPHTIPHQYPQEVHRQLNPAAVSMNGCGPQPHRQLNPATFGMNGCGPQPLGHSDGTGCLGSLRTYTQLGQAHPMVHSGGTPLVHHSNRNGFVRPRPSQQHPGHLSRPERLPSDLDGMSIEHFECDMESVLLDTFMDEDALDQWFPNFTWQAPVSQ
ncbi:forkhead box protein O1-A-like [Clupea harengus]|uniref:Forkhead box protein O1-A-like n=1 Tax=Clupea harengus TaxID=7950 RepID=A0A8M1KEE1_CLUHA|nr:forkhead box protein O1-A-like [Clupea harengus]